MGPHPTAMASDRLLFLHGDMQRDFTYVDDIIEGVTRLLDKAPNREENMSITGAPYRVFNIGNSAPVELMEMIGALEKHLGMTAEKEFLPMQPGDVKATSADVASLERVVGFKPGTSINDGVKRFVDWYREYYSA